jgi:hypothetical protein
MKDFGSVLEIEVSLEKTLIRFVSFALVSFSWLS